MAGTARMERTAAVLHAEVVIGAAIANRARGAAENFMVYCFTKSEEVWRKKVFMARAEPQKITQRHSVDSVAVR